MGDQILNRERIIGDRIQQRKIVIIALGLNLRERNDIATALAKSIDTAIMSDLEQPRLKRLI